MTYWILLTGRRFLAVEQDYRPFCLHLALFSGADQPSVLGERIWRQVNATTKHLTFKSKVRNKASNFDLSLMTPKDQSQGKILQKTISTIARL